MPYDAGVQILLLFILSKHVEKILHHVTVVALKTNRDRYKVKSGMLRQTTLD